MEAVRSEDTKARIKASMAETHARRKTQICRVFELKVSIRHNPTLADRIYKCDCGYTMDRDTHSARVVLMIGSSKRAECVEHASAEVATSMPSSSAGSAQVAPSKRKLEAHSL